MYMLCFISEMFIVNGRVHCRDEKATTIKKIFKKINKKRIKMNK